LFLGDVETSHHVVEIGDVAFAIGMMTIEKFLSDGWTERPIVPELGNCWEFDGYKDPAGYGRVRGVPAHRLAVMLDGREIPEGHHVLHACDYPPCVNPEHLRPGTRSENMQDMVAKGRHAYGRGDHHHATVLTDQQVRNMRDAYTGARGEISRLAEQHGISANQIGLILRGERRKSAGGRIHPKYWRAGGWPA
jgi:hypothetical protein